MHVFRPEIQSHSVRSTVVRNLGRFMGVLAAFVSLSVSLSLHAQEYVPGEVIVKLKGKMSSMNAKSFQSKAMGEKGMILKGSWSSLNLHHYAAKPGQDVKDLIRELKADPNVEFAEPNFIMKKAELEGEEPHVMSAEEATSYVNSMTASTSGFSLTAAPIQAVESWSQVSGSSLPIVAIVDTGVDLTHRALSNAIWVNTAEIANNGIDDDGNGYVDDVNGWNFNANTNYPMDCDGHGTHVAGIVRGTTQGLVTDSGTSIPAPKIRIMPLKFLDCYGSGSTADAIKAIYYAVNNGAKVINNSWGGGNYSRSLHEAIVYAYSKEVLFVAAAGNSGSSNDSKPMYPAAYDVPNVLAVAATNNYDVMASFSNYGATTVHAAAPGVSIFSTYVGGTYTTLNGTSMAAPFMAGIAGQILREQPTMSGYQLKTVILGSVDVVASLSGKLKTGGRLNTLAAVVAAKSSSVQSTQPTYTITASSQDREIAGEIAGNGSAGCGLVQKVGSSFASSGSGGGLGGGARAIGLLVLFALPLVVWWQMKRRVSSPMYQRKFDRFAIDSQVRLKVGGQELVGQVATISVGGAAFDAQVLLDKGSVVTMTIESPDGKERVQVQGQVMWSNADQKYGVQFVEANDTVTSMISGWTRALSKI